MYQMILFDKQKIIFYFIRKGYLQQNDFFKNYFLLVWSKSSILGLGNVTKKSKN